MDHYVASASLTEVCKADALTFPEKFLVNTPIDSNAIVESQAGVQRKSVEILPRVEIDGTTFAIFRHVLDGKTTFEIDDRHVALHGGSVQSRGGGLPSLLTALVPRRGANSESL